jgi:hypothetical protein
MQVLFLLVFVDCQLARGIKLPPVSEARTEPGAGEAQTISVD